MRAKMNCSFHLKLGGTYERSYPRETACSARGYFTLFAFASRVGVCVRLRESVARLRAFVRGRACVRGRVRMYLRVLVRVRVLVRARARARPCTRARPCMGACHARTHAGACACVVFVFACCVLHACLCVLAAYV